MSHWHCANKFALISTTSPTSYADRFRIRPPGDAAFALGPHVDAGSWRDGKKRAMAAVRYTKPYSAANGKNTILGKATAVFPSCQTSTMGLELAPCSVCSRVGFP